MSRTQNSQPDADADARRISTERVKEREAAQKLVADRNLAGHKRAVATRNALDKMRRDLRKGLQF